MPIPASLNGLFTGIGFCEKWNLCGTEGREIEANSKDGTTRLPLLWLYTAVKACMILRREGGLEPLLLEGLS